jgi:putative spermidine/putrescine transport system ATP-binding protein
MATAKLVLRDVSKLFGTFIAVDRCNLEIRAGEFLTLLGPSGSGKTTMLRMVAGFVRPSSGTIELDGHDITTVPPYRRNLGMVFQSYTLFPHMTAAENVAFPLQMRKVGRNDQRRIVAEALERVRLSGMGDRYPRALSGGQQQRVALARALVFQPQLLLMDEPLGALDRRLREGMQLEIRRLHQSLGITVVFVTHDQSEALAMSDRIAIVNSGRIVQLGTGAELYEAPASLFAAEFMGESNQFPGRLQNRGGVLRIVSKEWEFGIGAERRPDGADLGDQVVLIVRPERMRLCRNGEAARPGSDGLLGRLVATTYLGATSRHQIETPHGKSITIVSLGRDAAGISIGDEVRAEWSVDDGVVVLASRAPE